MPHVLDDGAGGGGDDADGAGECGNFLFVFRIKQPLALEFGFQLQKASLQISLSCSFYLPDDQLELPPVRVYGGAAQDMDFHPFLEPYGAFGSRCLEKGAENFRSLFLQGEINVAAGVMLDVTQFSHHPLGAHSDADRVPQAVNELFDCDGFGRGGRFLREFHKLRFKGDVQRFIRQHPALLDIQLAGWERRDAFYGNNLLGAPEGRQTLVNQAVPDESSRLVHVIRHQGGEQGYGFPFYGIRNGDDGYPPFFVRRIIFKNWYGRNSRPFTSRL